MTAIELAISYLDKDIDKLGTPTFNGDNVEWYTLQALVLGRTLLRTAKAQAITVPEQFELLRKRARLLLIEEPPVPADDPPAEPSPPIVVVP